LAVRQQDLRLKQLRKEGARIYSISKLNALDGCLREAYFSYRDPSKPKRMQSIYGIMGGEIHEVLEDIYNGWATPDALLPAMEKELADADLVGVEFPKDFSGGDAVKNNWIADMTHFCNNFEILPGDNFSTEELVIYQFGENRYMQGYIDIISVIDEEAKIIDIFDFKTSAKFKKQDLVHHGRQLVFYGMAKEAEGYTIRNIAWIMLKYAEVTYQGYARSNSKNKSTITKVIQRGKLAKELSPIIESMLYELGYGEIDVELFLDEFKSKNDIKVLPEEIQEQFDIHQYIEYYDYNDDTKTETLQYINDKADKFEELWDKEYSEWSPMEITDKDSFYCNNLCSHRGICDEIRKYNDLLVLQKIDEDDLF